MSYARPYRIQHQRQGAWRTVERHEDLDSATYAADRDQSMRQSEGRYVPPMRVLFEDRDPINGTITYSVLWGDGNGTTWTESLDGGKTAWQQFAETYLDPKKIGRTYLRVLDFFTTLLIRVIIVGGIFLALAFGVPWAIDQFLRDGSGETPAEQPEATSGEAADGAAEADAAGE